LLSRQARSTVSLFTKLHINEPGFAVPHPTRLSPRGKAGGCRASAMLEQSSSLQLVTWYVGPLLHRPKLFRVITPATRAAPKKRVR